jgi:exosortase
MGVPETNTFVPADEVSQQRQEHRFLTGKQWRVLIVSLLLAALYADVLASLADDWWTNESYSHGFLVVPLAFYIAWKQRHTILATPIAPSAQGIYLTGIGCLLFAAGKLGAEFFATRISLVLVVAGLVWTFWGKKRLRHLAFPLLLVASVVPLPVIVYNSLAAPLQLLASNLATLAAQFFGVAVYRDGNIIQLADTSLGVAEACSGLRSLGALAVGALLLGFLERFGIWARVGLFVLAIPIAIFFNIIRVTGTALLAERDPDLAMGFYHAISGWLIFVAGFGTLLLCTKILKYLLDRKQGALRA